MGRVKDLLPMSEPLEWSLRMERLFNKRIAAPILNDPRTDLSQDIKLGYPFEVIRKEVLKEGLADFSKDHDDNAHGVLTAMSLNRHPSSFS